MTRPRHETGVLRKAMTLLKVTTAVPLQTVPAVYCTAVVLNSQQYATTALTCCDYSGPKDSCHYTWISKSVCEPNLASATRLK